MQSRHYGKINERLTLANTSIAVCEADRPWTWWHIWFPQFHSIITIVVKDWYKDYENLLVSDGAEQNSKNLAPEPLLLLLWHNIVK